ncbi:MAG TPA: HAMP domain-containing histidine kinase [Campylobacterales bacterium]|nr:HAMP domain-containing histidine kinase [Campylobacterales bacterium]
MSEESVIKYSEKESLLKSFLLFFVVIELFLSFIFYNFYKLEEEHLSEQLFLEMKNYSFFFDDERFDIDIVPKEKKSELYELHFEKENLYILVPLAEGKEDILKIFYPQSEYQGLLDALHSIILKQFIFLSLVALIISLIFSFYALSPMRKSLILLEEFIRDIIHDLNTPITAILINLKMMDSKNEEVESITRSAKTISMLHKNLDSYLKEMQFKKEKFQLKEVVDEQVEFFASMYDYLDWRVEVAPIMIESDRHAFSRIIYNLLSNACKYNTSHGFIHIKTENHILTITNDSYGIKKPEKVFDRFYKESDRGIGIGLHIVEKLCKELDITKKLEIKGKIVTVTLDIS